MKQQEFELLKETVLKHITDSLQQDKDMLRSFNDSIAKSAFENLPKHREVIRTCNGIIGFHKHCISINDFSHFATNALHDICECGINYKKPWFSPRLSRFAQ